MHSRYKCKKLILSGLMVLLLATVAIVVGKLSESFETFAAGTYTAYDFQDWIYYDPVTGSADCDVNTYWTFYNTNTTCYRFFMAERNDNSSKSTVSLILDHNIDYGNFASVDAALSNTGTAWQDYNGQLSLITENQLMTLLTIQELPSIYKDSSGIHTIDRDGKYYRYASNTMSFIHGYRQNGHGYWTSTTREFNGTTYAYTLSESGWNRLVNVAENRGIRPVITLDKTKIASSSHDITDITSLVQNAQLYQYKGYSRYGTFFQQLQGFTVTDGNFKNSGGDNLIFYSSNSRDSNNGLIFSYTGSNFSTKLNGSCGGNPCYIGTGHGNDMTYNPAFRQTYIVGRNNIWKYDGTNAPTVVRKNSTSSIGYRDTTQDDFPDAKFPAMYFVNADFRTYLTDYNFNNVYMFDASTDEIGQGFEYHNGYLYYATSTTNIPCDASYHHCGSFNSMSGVIDVYNAKLESDGTPGKNFGKRVKRFYTNGNNLKMELESISFRDGKAYLGYSNNNYPQTTSDPPFKFYSFADSSIAIDLDAKVSYQDTRSSITVTISAADQLRPISGYTMSADGYSMSKIVDAATISDNLNVCDHYNNCTTVNISHTNPSYDPNILTQDVTFENDSASIVYGNIGFCIIASTTGDGTITYTSNNPSIASVDPTSGEVAIHSAGPVDIIATASATSTYDERTVHYPLVIAKATSTRPSELDIALDGVAGEPLSTINFTTPGFSWVDDTATISAGTNTYQVYYTQNNDGTNYTVETFTATVNGTRRSYEVIEGEGQIYTIGKSEKASFRVNADFQLFETDGQVYLDGDLVSQDNYEAESGSTIISLKKSYADNLSIGNHAITILFADQGIASAEFSVAASDPSSDDTDDIITPDASSVPDTISDTGDTDDNVVVPDTSSTPDTGSNTKDESFMANVILALPIALPTLVGIIIIARAKSIKHRKFDL